MTAATTPATDAEVAEIEADALANHDAPPSHTLALIARIHQEREQAIRECAEIARTFEDWGDYSGDLETASAQIHGRVLALLPTPPALSQEERT